MRLINRKEFLNILNTFITVVELSECDMDLNLIELGMDSVTFIQIIVAIEERFECEIPDEKLVLYEMNTAGKIYNLLEMLYERVESCEKDKCCLDI